MIMAVRKVARDLLFSKNLLLRQQVSRLQLVPPNVELFRREFSVFNDFSKKIKGETERNPELQEGFKGVKEDLKVRAKQTTEQLYKLHGVWTEDEAKAENVKYGFGMGKQESTLSMGTSGKDGSKSFGEEKQSPLSKMWEAFKMIRHPVYVLKLAMKIVASDHPPGYTPRYSELCVPELTLLYDEMKRRDQTFSHLQFFVMREVQKVVKQVLNDHFKIAEEDTRKFTHHPGFILDKIVFGEPDLIMLFRKMYPKSKKFDRRDLDLPEFHREVEKVVKPVLNAHFKKQGVDAIRVGEDHQILKGQTTMNQTLRDREVQEY